MKENCPRCAASIEDHEKNHLCQIIVQNDQDKVKELVKDAKYYCKSCGRAAHSEKNLCFPSKI